MSASASRRSRSRGSDNFVLGLLLGGALGLAAAAISGKPQSQKVIIGGIDLTNIDPTRPFFVDFSVGPGASNQQKADALQKLKTAMKDLGEAFPGSLCQTQVSADEGRFVLLVTPIAPPNATTTRVG